MEPDDTNATSVPPSVRDDEAAYFPQVSPESADEEDPKTGDGLPSVSIGHRLARWIGQARQQTAQVTAKTLQWFLIHTYTPNWLSPRWRRPGYSYLAALLVAAGTTLLAGLLLLMIPGLPLQGLLAILGVLFVAFTWGMGPSLVTTLVSAIFLNFFLLPPHFTLTLDRMAHVVATVLFVAVGCATSVLSGQVDRARRTAQSEQRRAEAAADRVRLLQMVTDTMLAHLGLEDLLRKLLERIQDALRVDNVAILLVSPEGQELIVYAARGPEEQVIGSARVPIGQGVAGRIAATCQPLIVEDLSSVEVANPFLREHLRSLVGVPLLVGGHLIGVMHMDSASPRHFTAEDVQLLERVADRVALAIDHAQLYEAEQQVRAEAARRASELEILFNAIADGVMVFAADGSVQRMNAAARTLLGLAHPADFYNQSLKARGVSGMAFDEQGESLAPEQWPYMRILQGQALTGADAADVIYRRATGDEVQISVAGAPVRDKDGQVISAVCVLRDVTERRQAERHAHESLAALLAIAEALVQAPEEEQQHPDHFRTVQRARHVAYRLAELTRSVLDCHRVSIVAVEPETGMQAPLAVVGLSQEEERWWWAEQQLARFGEGAAPEELARFLGGEIFTLDMTQPPYDALPNPYGITTVLIAPLLVSDSLVGILSLDHAGKVHSYTPEEIHLAEAVAKLGALSIERERLLNEREVAQAHALALQETTRRMDQFLGIVSHELKTPLSVLLVNAQMLDRRLQPTKIEDWQRAVDGIRPLLAASMRGIQRLTRLVDDLLDVSRIRAGKLELLPTSCDLVVIVRDAVEEQRQLHPQRSIALDLPTADDPLWVNVDAERISQVLTNYLTNALKYSADDRPVAVSIGTEGRWMRVAVHDKGPGLPAEERERVWEQFHRVEGIEVQSGSGVGLGLGLHISKSIIERHGGRVGIESELGRGATFWFTLPCASSI